MKTFGLGVVVAVSLALGGCSFHIPHNHDNDIQVKGSLVPSPKTQVVELSLESLDKRVSAIEHRLDAAKAYRARLAAEAAKKQQEGVFQRLRERVE